MMLALVTNDGQVLYLKRTIIARINLDIKAHISEPQFDLYIKKGILPPLERGRIKSKTYRGASEQYIQKAIDAIKKYRNKE